jgi:hypothetical protein
MFIKNKNQIALLGINVLLVFFSIVLSNLHILPLQFGDFIFFSILTLALTLYRPGWGFLFFVGTIMLENINLAPAELGIAIRPFQFFGGLTILAIIIRLATKRLNFKLTRLTWYDWMLILFGLASFASAIFATNVAVSLKQSIVLASFIALYFLVRNYIQTLDDLKKVIPFFLSSSIVVIGYGIWQNVQFMRGASNFEVMPGRPNGTFTEADWLGIFLSLLLALAYSLIFYLYKKRDDFYKDAQISNLKFQTSNQFLITKFQILQILMYVFLVVVYVLLILTVSRSAWLGALGVTVIFLLSFFTQLKMDYKKWQWKKTFNLKIKILLAFIASLALVFLFHLTTFQLGNRAQSTGSGLQKITISCLEKQKLGTQTWNTELLTKSGCRHINLEEIEQEKLAGNFVTEVYRIDPNVGVRSEIYKKSWDLIKQNPIWGIGWGNISSHLGTDERGTGLNASNIFLEIWLGAGIIGLLAFTITWIFIFLKASATLFFATQEEKALPLFILLGWFALTIPNLFNSGILLGFLWLFLGLAFITNQYESTN